MEHVKKVLLLSSSDDNGAHLYIVKLSEVLLEMGHNVKMLVKQKTQQLNFIVQYQFPPKRETLTQKIAWRLQNKLKPYQPLTETGDYAFLSNNELSENIDPEEVVRQVGFSPDVIISGMTPKFLNSTDLLNLQKYTGAKIFTSTVDMNPLTGGCHYAWDCEGYIHGCTNPCPAIGYNDRAKVNFQKKLANAKEGKFECIAGSGWTEMQIRQSKIYEGQKKIINLNSIIDTRIFNPRNKDIAKRIFGLEPDTFYILCGAQGPNPRKGFEYLKETIDVFSKQIGDRKASLLLVSHSKNSSFDEISIDKKFVPFITDYRLLTLLYQAVDVFVNSSVEDSGPMMVSEAMACGTPVVGFDMGVVNNLVITGENGYKARLRDAEDLAKGIAKIYNLSDLEYKSYSNNAYRQVVEFSSYEYAKKELASIII